MRTHEFSVLLVWALMAPIPAQEPVFRSPELVADNIFASRLILETLRLDAVNLNGDQIDEISVFEKRRLTTFVLRGGDYETQQFNFGQATGIAWGDLDDDGDVDAVVAIVRPTFEVVLLANDGEGRLTRQSLPFVFEERFPNDILLGDLDGDQRLDVITQPGNLLGEPTTRLSWYRNRGSGRFDEPKSIEVGTSFYRILGLADLRGTGRLDILAGYDNTLRAIIPNLGGARFGEPIYQGIDGRVSTVDWDTNGSLDFVSRDRQSLAWFRSEDRGTNLVLDTLIAADDQPARASAIADIDGDGVTDWLVSRELGKIGYYESSAPDGSAWRSIPHEVIPVYLAVGDYDGDGKADIAYLEDSQQYPLKILFQNASTSEPYSFEDWQTDRQVFGEPASDDDLDGLINLYEWAAPGWHNAIQRDQVVFQFLKNPPSQLTYELSVSTDLKEWESLVSRRGPEPWSEAPFGFSLVVHGQVESHYDRITLRESRTTLGASFFRLTVSESE